VILVAGGTGRLGTQVVQRLAERGIEVRVLTRDPRRAAHLAGSRADIVTGDVRRPGTLPAAFVGVDTVVSAVHGFGGPGRVSPRSVDRDGNTNLIHTAADVGADVVMVSVVGASPDSRMELFRCKHAAEQQLQASDLRWTIVRSTAFVELWADILAKGVVFGRGDNPINFVSVRDVAAAVEQAVLDKNLRGRVLEIVGPQDLTLNQLMDLVRNQRGRPHRLWHLPRWLLRAMAPLHRQPRAALIMDTEDMTFPGGRRGTGPDCLSIQDALSTPAVTSN
jgi:uncharacterized protein YbjT (DUF2867 family)